MSLYCLLCFEPDGELLKNIHCFAIDFRNKNVHRIPFKGSVKIKVYELFYIALLSSLMVVYIEANFTFSVVGGMFINKICVEIIVFLLSCRCETSHPLTTCCTD